MAGGEEPAASEPSAGSPERWRRGLAISAATLIGLFLCGEAVFRIFPIDRQLDYEFDDALYWRLKPDQTGFLWMGSGTFHSPPIQIDSRGFRSNGRETSAATGGKLRILFLGDSYTFGHGVRDEETFCALVEDRLGEYDVVADNGGGPGYGVFQSERRLRREFAAGGDPDIVVLTVLTGDVFRQPFSDSEFQQYRNRQKRRKRLRSVSRMATFFYRKYSILKQRRSDDGRAVPNERVDRDIATFRETWSLDEERIRGMKEACDAEGAKLVVLHWPQTGLDECNRIVGEGGARLARETSLVWMPDLTQKFENRALEELVIPGDGHPSALAHRIVAEYLAAEIRTQIETMNPASSEPKQL